MRAFLGALAAVLLVAMSAPVALAQNEADDDSAGARRDDGPHREGEYTGVVPGRPSKVKTGKARGLTASWVGFQERGNGSSRVFVRLNREAEYNQNVEGGTLRVTVLGARFGSRNVYRRIDTRFFDTALAEVTMGRGKGKGRRRGIDLRLKFKNPASAGSASASMQKESDGYVYLYLDLGPGAPASAD